jgi:hypothetical protein
MKITLELPQEAIQALASAIAEAMGGATPSDGRPELTAAATPPSVQDKKKPTKTEAPPVEEPEDEPTDDLVTDAQLESVKEAAADAELDDVRASLADYYISAGEEKKSVNSTISGMSEEDLRAAYADYLARLLPDDKDGEFCEDYETPYIATRVFGGEEVKKWVLGGLTLTDEQVEEKELGDPNETKKKGPALPKRTPKPGAKKK